MPKWVKAIAAIFLLPVCAGAVQALGMVLRHSGNPTPIWVALASGAACWLLIYALLPKPMWVYVFGHEFTHALWTWLFGGQVKQIKVSSKGGHVVVTRHNFLTSLAPYFFPFYVVLVILAYAAGNLIWDWTRHVVWFHLLLGAAYAFHLSLTWHILKTEQSDISQHGYLFSAVVIYLGNIAVLLIGIPLLAGQVGVLMAMDWWLKCTGDFFRQLIHLL